MGVFSECQVALELDSSLPFKKKLALKRKVIDNGGVISFIVTKKVSVFRPACISPAVSRCHVTIPH